jgi:hypothetical protein
VFGNGAGKPFGQIPCSVGPHALSALGCFASPARTRDFNCRLPRRPDGILAVTNHTSSRGSAATACAREAGYGDLPFSNGIMIARTCGARLEALRVSTYKDLYVLPIRHQGVGIMQKTRLATQINVVGGLRARYIPMLHCSRCPQSRPTIKCACEAGYGDLHFVGRMLRTRDAGTIMKQR